MGVCCQKNKENIRNKIKRGLWSVSRESLGCSFHLKWITTTMTSKSLSGVLSGSDLFIEEMHLCLWSCRLWLCVVNISFFWVFCLKNEMGFLHFVGICVWIIFLSHFHLNYVLFICLFYFLFYFALHLAVALCIFFWLQGLNQMLGNGPGWFNSSFFLFVALICSWDYLICVKV